MALVLQLISKIKSRVYLLLLSTCLGITASCVSDYLDQPVELSSHYIDFGETKVSEIVTVNYSGTEMANYSSSVESLETNWVIINNGGGKISDTADIEISIDRSLMPEGEATAKVNIKVGDIIKSIYITASHPSEVEITPELLNFESGIDRLDLVIRSRIGGKKLNLVSNAEWLELSPQTIEVPRYNVDKSDETTVIVHARALKDNLGVGEYTTEIVVKEIDGAFEQTIKVTLVKDDKEYLQRSVDNMRISLDDFIIASDYIRVNFSFKNLSSSSISFLPIFKCAFDDYGNYGQLFLKKIDIKDGTSTQQYSFSGGQLTEPLLVGGEVSGTGYFDILGLSNTISVLQYLEISSNLSSPFIFRDIILPGKEGKSIPEIIDAHYDNNGFKLQIFNAEEIDGMTIVSFAFTSENEITNSTLNLDSIIAVDNNDIAYKATDCSFRSSTYQKEFNVSVPDNVFVSGTVSFPMIESISSVIKSVQFEALVNGDSKIVEIQNLNLCDKGTGYVEYSKIVTFDYFDFYLVGCYPDKDDIIIDCIVKNNRESDRILLIDLGDSYIIDDTGEPHRLQSIKFTDGNNSDLFPSTTIHGKYANRAIIKLSDVDSASSGLQYCFFDCWIDGNVYNQSALVINSRISVQGRNTYNQPESKVSYTVSQVPDRIKMELIDIQYESGNAIVSFRIANESSDSQKIRWNLYSTNSYALDNDEAQHYITKASIGYYSIDHGYFSLDIPGKIMVKGSLIIPDIDSETKKIKRLLLYNYDGNIYDFSQLSW